MNLAALILLLKLNVTNESTVSFQQRSRLTHASVTRHFLFYGHFLEKTAHLKTTPD